MIQDTIIRRSVRLLAAIHELHKNGYQNLAIYCCMSPSGCHWRLSLLPYNYLYLNHNRELQYTESIPEVEEARF